jgi:hypothetical protein
MHNRRVTEPLAALKQTEIALLDATQSSKHLYADAFRQDEDEAQLRYDQAAGKQ